MPVGGSLAGRSLGAWQGAAEAGPERYRGKFPAVPASPMGVPGSHRDGVLGRCRRERRAPSSGGRVPVRRLAAKSGTRSACRARPPGGSSRSAARWFRSGPTSRPTARSATASRGPSPPTAPSTRSAIRMATGSGRPSPSTSSVWGARLQPAERACGPVRRPAAAGPPRPVGHRRQLPRPAGHGEGHRPAGARPGHLRGDRLAVRRWPVRSPPGHDQGCPGSRHDPEHKGAYQRQLTISPGSRNSRLRPGSGHHQLTPGDAGTVPPATAPSEEDERTQEPSSPGCRPVPLGGGGPRSAQRELRFERRDEVPGRSARRWPARGKTPVLDS
jgi:hypothetical protein